MGWPGEQLLGKLWESLADKGVGSLLKPGQMRREGLVALQLKRAEMLSLAQTKKDIEDIESGRRDISELSMDLGLAKDAQLKPLSFERREPILNIVEALDHGKANVISDAVRRDINTSGSIIYAEEALCNDPDPAPDATVDDDWLYRWRDYTGEVSDADLQKIWGRLLAGEVKTPGTYSLRTLDFLRNLSHSEASLIAKVSAIVTDGFIWRPDDNSYAVAFDELLDLQEMGFLIGVDSIGLHFTLTKNIESDGSWVSVLQSHDKCIVVRGSANTRDEKLQVNVISVSRMGNQILGLGDFKADPVYLKKFGKFISSFGVKVSVATQMKAEPGYVRWEDEMFID